MKEKEVHKALRELKRIRRMVAVQASLGRGCAVNKIVKS
jgi:hypothetical protein